MNIQQITEQAAVYADKMDFRSISPRQVAVKAYTDGVMAAKTHFWHPIEELPDSSQKSIIMLTSKRRRLKQTDFSGAERWFATARQINACQWAYKEDLING